MSQFFTSPTGVSLFERKEALRLGGESAQNKLCFSICKNLDPQAPSTHLYPLAFLVERNTSLNPWFTTLPETSANYLATYMPEAHLVRRIQIWIMTQASLLV